MITWLTRKQNGLFQQKHKRVLRIVAAFISVALIVAGVVYFAVLSGAKKTETIPIEDLQIEKGDSYPSESFSMN